MKKLFYTFLLLCTSIGAWAQCSAIGGLNDKEDDYYLIDNADEFIIFANHVNSVSGCTCKCKLTADIDFNGKNMPRIGLVGNEFAGEIDGANHTIKNLTHNITDSDGDNQTVGFIGAATGGMTVKYLAIDESCSFTTAGGFAGAFVGSVKPTENKGQVTIDHCTNRANVTAAKQNAGAFLGCNFDGDVKIYIAYCANSGDISGGSESAAFSGWIGGHSEKIVKYSYNTGKVTGLDGTKTLYRWSGNENIEWCYDLAKHNGVNAGSNQGAELKDMELYLCNNDNWGGIKHESRTKTSNGIKWSWDLKIPATNQGNHLFYFRPYGTEYMRSLNFGPKNHKTGINPGTATSPSTTDVGFYVDNCYSIAQSVKNYETFTVEFDWEYGFKVYYEEKPVEKVYLTGEQYYEWHREQGLGLTKNVDGTFSCTVPKLESLSPRVTYYPYRLYTKKVNNSGNDGVIGIEKQGYLGNTSLGDTPYKLKTEPAERFYLPTGATSVKITVDLENETLDVSYDDSVKFYAVGTLYDHYWGSVYNNYPLTEVSPAVFKAILPFSNSDSNQAFTLFEERNGYSDQEWMQGRVGPYGESSLSKDSWSQGLKRGQDASWNFNQPAGNYLVTFDLYNEKVMFEDASLTTTIKKKFDGRSTMYYGNKNLKVPEGVKAVTYTVDGSTLEVSKEYESGEVIPAGEAVVLIDLNKEYEGETDSHEYTFELQTTSTETKDESSMLKGSDVAAQTEGDNCTFYVLTTKNDTDPGFYWGAKDGGVFQNNAHKAYLAVPKDKAAGISAFRFDDEETAIQSLVDTESTKTNEIYNLAGQRLSRMQKGINIVNGQKVLVK
ncbi:MAG: hypothetical protein HUK03_04895 [Bacteroidaceae bacterium]|nr:hypothetical protein [Bacteroidaceae bacterium]